MQTSIFPVKITDEEPFEGEGADLKLIGYDAAGRKFAIKRMEDKPTLPITEWFAYNLCRELGILTPSYDVIELNDGTKAFGSLWEDESTIVIHSMTNQNPTEVATNVAQASKSINKALPQDILLGNPDRHIGNFMFKMLNKQKQVITFDWSRATALETLFNGSLCQTSATLKTARYMHAQHGLSKTVAADAQNIANIKTNTIEAILNAAPPEWLTGINTQNVVSWWSNNIDKYQHKIIQTLCPKQPNSPP